MNTKRRAHCQLWHDWKERIIRIGDEQTSLQNQFDNLRNEFTDNSPRIEALEADVNALDGRLIIAESDIADAEDRITACEADIDRIDAELVDKTGEINNLANRMSLAEADIDDIDARLEGIEGGEILLSQLNVDADKNWQGRTIRNVNLNNVTVRGGQIEPTRINNDILILDFQTDIELETLPTYDTHRVSYKLVEGPFDKCAFADTTTGPITIDNFTYLHHNRQPIRAKPNKYLNAELWYRIPEGEYETTNKIYVGIISVDINGAALGDFIALIPYQPLICDNEWHKLSGRNLIPSGYRYFAPRIFINHSPPRLPIDICGLCYYYDADFDSDLSAKIISADGVVIKDGGTVDGVDISTHTHDGTAIGGPKISYNDLVDKPTIPRPPMPFKKSVSINLASPGDYIDVIPGTKYGRTVLTLERLQYRSIANILEGTGAFVVIGLIYDDNTVGTAIDRVTINGDTDWHPPTYYGLNQTYQFTKNYIKGIRIERTPGEGPPITGYVDIIGYLY